jgi:SET domain-containing protein
MKLTKTFRPSDKIEVRRSKKYGNRSRAIYAIKEIAAGEIIEDCPVIRMPVSDIFSPTLFAFIFHWLDDRKYSQKGFSAIALGYGSLYNHSNEPNAKFTIISVDCLRFEALRKIKKGEEITIHYQQNDRCEVKFPATCIPQ